MVVRESKYDNCYYGDIVIGTGEVFMPNTSPSMHRYEVDDNGRIQILEDNQVIEIGKL